MAGQWTPNAKQRKLQRKQTVTATRNREWCANGTKQRIGKPGGNNDAAKKLATPLLPIMRHPVIG